MLKLPIKNQRLVGLKIAFFGMLIAFVGFGVSFLVELLGWALIAVGFLIVIVGGVVHAYMVIAQFGDLINRYKNKKH